MSGIAGIIYFDGRPVEPGQVEDMTAAMHYRGPDGIDPWRRGNVALGQCMLRTTPESLEETQPLANEDESLVLVMDGRVDNWEELRRELLGKGAVLRTRADAELVLRAYEVWGRDCLPRIDGDFALVIWDARRQEVFCVRDRTGNKPFNYHFNGKTLAFASDLHTILALPWVPEVMNQNVLAEYLGTDWYSLDETLWQEVLRLKPAHSMVAGPQRSLALQRYWAPDPHLTLPCKTDEDYIEHYRALFTEVVRRMSRSHLPLAYEVSGGLDSSAIFAVAEALSQQGRLCAPGLEGYTLDFSGDPAADEMAYARAVGTHLGRPIHEITPAHMPLDWYREVAHLYREFPDYPNGAMGFSITETARSSGSRVLISGTGGDEWAGGSGLYYAEAIAGWRAREVLTLLKRDAQEAGGRVALGWLLRRGLFQVLPSSLQQCIRAVAAFAAVRERGQEQQAAGWLAPAMQQRLAQRRKQNEPGSSPGGQRIGQRRQWLNLADPYIILSHEMCERQASSVGLEWRQPFWNAQIIQCAFATPTRLQFRGLENKWLHRRALAGLLPEQVLRRQSKAEFSVTFSRYWADLAPHLTGTVLARRPAWVNPQAVRSMLTACSQQDPSDWPDMAMWVLWALFSLDAVANYDQDEHRQKYGSSGQMFAKCNNLASITLGNKLQL